MGEGSLSGRGVHCHCSQRTDLGLNDLRRVNRIRDIQANH